MCPLLVLDQGQSLIEQGPSLQLSCDLGHSGETVRGEYRRNALNSFALLTNFTNSVSVLHLYSTSKVGRVSVLGGGV